MVRPEPAAAAAAWKAPTSASEPEEEEVELVVVVRDYAFPRDDPRFEGKMLPEEIEAAAERKRFRDQQEEEERGGAGWLVDQDGSVLVGGGGGGGAAASGAGAAGPSCEFKRILCLSSSAFRFMRPSPEPSPLLSFASFRHKENLSLGRTHADRRTFSFRSAFFTRATTSPLGLCHLARG